MVRALGKGRSQTTGSIWGQKLGTTISDPTGNPKAESKHRLGQEARTKLPKQRGKYESQSPGTEQASSRNQETDPRGNPNLESRNGAKPGSGNQRAQELKNSPKSVLLAGQEAAAIGRTKRELHSQQPIRRPAS